MYKILVPAFILISAVACGDAAVVDERTKTENALRADAVKTSDEANKADADLARAAAVADAKDKEAAAANAEWREYQAETWNPNWDKFEASTETKWESPDYSYERTKEGVVVVRVDDTNHEHSRVEDSVLAASVNAQYVTDKDVKAHRVSVEVVDNVVHLRGVVGSKAEAREAVRLAINTRGVHKVFSHLTVGT